MRKWIGMGMMSIGWAVLIHVDWRVFVGCALVIVGYSTHDHHFLLELIKEIRSLLSPIKGKIL